MERTIFILVRRLRGRFCLLQKVYLGKNPIAFFPQSTLCFNLKYSSKVKLEEKPLTPCSSVYRDAFTSCLLSPLLMALRFYYLNDSLRLSETMKEASPNVSKANLLEIPGELYDRETVS